MNKSDLHPYQLQAVEHILTHPRTALFLEMGLGKTISTLTAIEELMYHRFEVTRVLIIAPLRVALETWSNESQKWEHTKKLTISKLLGTKKQRQQALTQNTDLHIINVDNLPWLITELGNKWDYDMVVIDESSMFKSHATQRFKALKHHTGFYKSRLLLLTGTPSPNSLLDLWSQIYLIDQGKRLEKGITAYRNKYFTPGKHNGPIVYEWKLQDGAEQRIHNKISDICISMKSTDYLTLPSVRYTNIEVHLTPKEQQQYKHFKQDMLLEYAPDHVITASNAAVLSGKLRQYSGGAIYKDNTDQWVEVNNAKIERLQEVLNELHTPVLIAYEYRHELERLRQALPHAHTIDEPEIINRWNKGEVEVLLGHPASMGHGLNLQAGGHVVIWYTVTWSLELYQQMNARLARQGQQDKVTIYHLITSHTIDTHVLHSLQRKDTSQTALMNAVRATLHETQ